MKTSDSVAPWRRAVLSVAAGCIVLAPAIAAAEEADAATAEASAAVPPVTATTASAASTDGGAAVDAAAGADAGAVADDAVAEGALASPESTVAAAKPVPGGRSRELTLQTTSVSGNRELPRVMVVVPWKTAAPAELGGRPIVSLVEEALAPVDPEVFRRRLEYYALLHGEAAEETGKLAQSASNLTEE